MPVRNCHKGLTSLVIGVAVFSFAFSRSATFRVEAQEAANAQTPTPAATDDTIAPDRPDFTNGTDTVPVGRIQIEGGATFTLTDKARQHQEGELLVRIPTGKKSEVRLGVPSLLRDRDPQSSPTGLGDAALGAKFTLSAAKHSLPATALLLNAILPTGARSVSEHTFQPQATLALDWDFSDTTGLGVNVGYGRLTSDGERFDQLFASASLGYSLSKKLGGFAEVYGFNKTDPTGQSRRYADTGFSYTVNPDLALDVRIGFGLNNHVGGPDFFTGFGASRRF